MANLRKNTINKIFVDLDDVLCDFEGAYYRSFGRWWKDIPIVSERWDNINYTPGFFANLPYRENVSACATFWARIRYAAPNVKILTATGVNYKEVTVQKKSWCWRMLGIDPDDVIAVEHRTEKARYSAPDALLIDDNTDNCREWREAGGHVTVSMVRDWRYRG